jgi:HD-GYP domain-containing protein (c-di-GMP phosphodiesterase class II)
MELSGNDYLTHLAAVNADNKVVLSEEIFNNNGVLVVKKGVEVNRDLIFKVAKHKLAKPIDESITLSDVLTHEKILHTLEQRLESLGVLALVKDTVYFQEVSLAFKQLDQYPQVLQKVSILESRMPEVFGRSLTTSGMALALCRELKLPNETVQTVFLANMMADIGLLHISPAIVSKEGAFTPDERKMMQGHVAIAKHFADSVPNLPNQVGRALLEHHERMDGFGYPFGKQNEELCVEGQVIAIVDKVNGLVQKLINGNSYSWSAILHVMQIPSTAHSPEIHKAMIRLLRNFSLPYAPAFSPERYPNMVIRCMKKRKKLQLWFMEFAKVFVNHKALLTDNENFKPLALLSKLQSTIDNTGLLNDAQHTWLSALYKQTTPTDYADLEEFALLLDEVEYRCVFVMGKMEAAKVELAKRFGGLDLLTTYYQGLNKILMSEQ